MGWTRSQARDDDMLTMALRIMVRSLAKSRAALNRSSTRPPPHCSTSLARPAESTLDKYRQMTSMTAWTSSSSSATTVVGSSPRAHPPVSRTYATSSCSTTKRPPTSASIRPPGRQPTRSSRRLQNARQRKNSRLVVTGPKPANTAGFGLDFAVFLVDMASA